MVDPARDELLRSWAHTAWEVFEHGLWLSLPDRTVDSVILLSAWNPSSMRLSTTVNQARDAVLESELRAVGLLPCRSRGRSTTSEWLEEGWMIPHDRQRSRTLLCRYGQHAGLVIGADGWGLFWHDGMEQPWPS